MKNEGRIVELPSKMLHKFDVLNDKVEGLNNKVEVLNGSVDGLSKGPTTKQTKLKA